jgi:hypothetical protein
VCHAAGLRVPELNHDEDVLRADGVAILTEVCGRMFRHLRPS